MDAAKLVQEQLALDDKWRAFDQNIFKTKSQFDSGLLHKRLGAILKSLKDPENMNQMFDHVEESDMKAGAMTSINMQFNTQTNEVKVSSGGNDKKGHPLYEFVMNADTGVIQQIKRDPVTSHEKIVEKNIDPIAVDAPKAVTVQPKKSEPGTFDASQYTSEWDDLDAQRDLAFKIVYFFIAFILFTFGLLYAYFRLHQKELEEERSRKNRVPKQLAMANDNESFFDFLVGQVDYEKNPVNPKGNPYLFNKQSERTTSASEKFDQRQNNGFGSNNLDSLQE
jgi:hypothetical protein